jgi:isopenicillin-N epimerase
MLKPGSIFLNHGSFGALPHVVFDAQNEWRRRIEAEPIEMIGRRMNEFLDAAKIPIGKQFGMNPADFGFVTNATEGVNAVLRSLPFSPGDELLTTNHVYHAIRQTMKLVARQRGATCREISIPTPVKSSDEIRDIVLNAISPKAKLLVIDHVTSPTALVFPAKEIIKGCREKGVEVLVDGAHAPGMLPLDVRDIGATYYAANLHKWVCAPKGTAFLWVSPDHQSRIHPTVISHFLDEGFTKEFNWQGTRDFSGWLAAPAALDFLNDFGFEKVMNHNHQMATWAQQLLANAWGTQPLCTFDGSLLGSMTTVPLPPPLNKLDGPASQALQQRLYTDFQIETPLVGWAGQQMLRVSCQIYNQPHEYEYVAITLLKIRV